MGTVLPKGSCFKQHGVAKLFSCPMPTLALRDAALSHVLCCHVNAENILGQVRRRTFANLSQILLLMSPRSDVDLFCWPYFNTAVTS